ncbi:acyl-CoA dehydrogenase [Actinomadura sp. KC345]|uniref:acyl-CoA dehydrogenase family protein n=1 Tax=Actinomadura sp. KC345 TaxID=2530371 RepID=UPI00104E9B61|nr:acyl-CoA dehydrogenase family protein [Actinomadura sp. KC345]TDC57425.1 acyl-CoA dehydrogenase [Actinomadura sp. KC345]
MDVGLSAEQHQLVDSFTSLFSGASPPSRVREAEPLGFDASLWGTARSAGVLPMAVGEDAGGWGARLLDLALVAELQGRFLAPAPIIEAQAAARLLARLGTPPASAALAAALAGERTVTVAFLPARGGVARLVPAGAVADGAVVLNGDRLLLVQGCGARAANLGSLPLADLPIGPDADVLATGPEAVAAHEAAQDEFLLLTAAAQVGIAARALEIGVGYVKERTAWNVPIGSFQAVAHTLADVAAAVDGARLLAYEAAWAATEEPERFAELAALAFGFAAETARDATYHSLHFHGGYGFTDEYDVQLYYRRARAWAGVCLEPRAAYRRAADRRYGPAQMEEQWTSA